MKQSAAKKSKFDDASDLAKITFYLPPEDIVKAREEALRFTKGGIRQTYHDILRMAVNKGLEQIKKLDVAGGIRQTSK